MIKAWKRPENKTQRINHFGKAQKKRLERKIPIWGGDYNHFFNGLKLNNSLEKLNFGKVGLGFIIF